MSKTQNSFDWIECLTGLAQHVGFNPVRVRWKLISWQNKWNNLKQRPADDLKHIKYKHSVCQHCGQIQDRKEKVCTKCGEVLDPRWLQIINRVNAKTARLFSITNVLIGAILLCYFRSVIANGNFDITAISSRILVRLGGNLPDALPSGEWWRLTSYIFLHAGLWHILFNLVALSQIGPPVEALFGRGRLLFYFMLTGVVAGLGSELMGLGGVGIGASGSLMGLVGLVAGWGQRTGTPTSLRARDLMIRWGLYTLVFGFMVGADNAAHFAGFLCGGCLGLCSHEHGRHSTSILDWLLTAIGTGLAVCGVLVVLWPQPQWNARLVDYGIYAVNQGAKIADDSVASGLVETGQLKLVESTDHIRAKIGTSFGFRYILSGPDRAAEVRIVVEHPAALHNPETGRDYSRSSWEQWVPVGSVNWNTGWLFEYDWEIVPGEWIIQLYVKDKKLLEKSFVVEDGRRVD